ncbi:MAG: efflux RND transporter permease subunit [Gemmataceae bacterium]|nr:efflux RND transporter permease subunit [Gemmataceae bacterium]
MLARFFIDRPVFAWVISIVIVFGGLVAYFVLPIAQYPEITPPTVSVTCTYPGADATVVADTVAAPIEQQVNGVENMLYMSSQSSNDGSYTLNVTFKLGTNLDMAQVLVQNRVAIAMPSLPSAVQATGVTTKKKSPNILLVVNLFSDENPETKKPYYDQLFLSNYATIQVKDELARLEGVGDVSFLGQQDYSMRIWLDPDLLATRGLTAGDVSSALKEQNVQVAAGAIGRPPVPSGQQSQLTMTALGRLTDPQQFSDIIVRAGKPGEGGEPDTAVVRLRDVGRVELGSKSLDQSATLDGKPTVGIAIFQLPGTNALETAERVKKKMKDLATAKTWKQGLQYAIVYDTTPFIEESVHEVIKTLRDAVILVTLVVLLFLQDWRATILPLIDVGVSLIGTMGIMYLLGFTLNNLTLFGLVLAIGIVVDDAIMVIENIEVWLNKGYAVREATIRAMGEITGPIIGVTLVLCSVFLPSAMIPGITGQFYKQFALVIAASMVLSATNAMTMTPARASSVFGHRTPGQEHHGEALPRWGVVLLFGFLAVHFLEPLLAGRLGGDNAIWGVRAGLGVVGGVAGWFIAPPLNHLLGILFRGFNKFFEAATAAYGWTIGKLLRVFVIVGFVYCGLLVLTYVGFTRLPTGFIPSQDKGYLVFNVQLPDSASLERTIAVQKQLEKIVLETEGVGHVITNAGQSFVLNAFSSNFGGGYIVLKPFEDRRGHHLSADAIGAAIRGRVIKEIPEALVSIFGAPAVDGLGNAGGFKLMVQDRGSLGMAMLAGQADELADQGNKQPGLVGLFNGFRANTPQLFVDIDRTKCKTLGVPLSTVFDTLQIYMGGLYVNDFNDFGRNWQVNIQADQKFRADAATIRTLKVRNNRGDMVPLGTLAEVRDNAGPVTVTRYNMFPAAPINGGSMPGVSTGTVIRVMDDLAEKLPAGMTTEWTELTYLQIIAGNTAVFAFVGAVSLVFLVLAAQYESWSLPLAVILVVPMCVLCSVVGIMIAKMDMNIFVQIGFVVLVGLACKNAILVVEFARERQKEGMPAFEAAVTASTQRLRPIIMTSLAFILGVVPLVIAHGAGAEMRRTLGTAVFSGMLGVTGFGIFLTPVFYYAVARIARPVVAEVHKPDEGKDAHDK